MLRWSTMKRRRWLAGTAMVAVCASLGGVRALSRSAPFFVEAQAAMPAPGQAAQTSSAETSPQHALVNRYCAGCHNDRLRTAGLSLTPAMLNGVGENAEVWEKV